MLNHEHHASTWGVKVMGAHYSRHVENEAKVIRAFAKQKKV